MTESNVIALNMNRERTASTASGFVMLLLLLVAICVQFGPMLLRKLSGAVRVLLGDASADGAAE